MYFLVITTEPDPHVMMVQNHLKGIQLICVDPKKFPGDLTLSYYSSDHTHHITLNGLNITDVPLIWYRKPYFLDMEQMPVKDTYKPIIHESYKHFFRWLYAAFPNTHWVSDPWAILRANNKVLQMNIAHTFGMTLPRTLITNDPVKAREFMASIDVVIKPLHQGVISEENALKVMYTRYIKVGQVISFEGLGVNPMIFQEALLGTDVRVTVIGERVFPCLIEKTGSAKDIIDWRASQFGGDLRFSIDKDFPESLVSRCVRVVRGLGLVYGAFDFIKVGEIYFFLEVNPNGQWGFIELEGVFPLSKAMSDFFVEYAKL